MNLFSTFRRWHEAGTAALVLRVAATGFAAGLASWLLLYGLNLVAGTGMPNASELVLALVMGTLFGAVLGFILGTVWDRRSE
jgi:hypothetical protein